MKRWPIVVMMCLLLLTACGSKAQIMDGDGMLNSYRQITQEEAKEMMLRDDGHVIVDVRRQEEYDAGHIPGAILIPNESIDTTPPEELPDLNQIILIYCRSGNRSKQAAQKLFDMGYTNICEFGGITTWTGEIVTEDVPQAGTPSVKNTADVSFESFDGGGPEFSVRIDDPEIASFEITKKYDRDDHEEMDGAGYRVVISFTGRKAGETTATVSARSPIADNYDVEYSVKVDGAGGLTLEELSRKELN